MVREAKGPAQGETAEDEESRARRRFKMRGYAADIPDWYYRLLLGAGMAEWGQGGGFRIS